MTHASVLEEADDRQARTSQLCRDCVTLMTEWPAYPSRLRAAAGADAARPPRARRPGRGRRTGPSSPAARRAHWAATSWGTPITRTDSCALLRQAGSEQCTSLASTPASGYVIDSGGRYCTAHPRQTKTVRMLSSYW
ncbi:hypothetical protein SSAG_01320 [Streptomyces sp. Mg1]|nr:hypothetical protein SSAG_01320 [Streptomyces sp. Mg1]